MRLDQHINALAAFAGGRGTPASLSPLMKGLADPGQRALVYRNSGVLACVEALRSNYQRLASVMGDDFFAALARAYVDAEPPSSRSLVGYGGSLPRFISESESEHGLPWLADIARLDRAWLESHLSPDARPLVADDLAGLDSATLMTSSPVTHPSLRIVETEWTTTSLWTDLSTGNLPRQQTALSHRTEHALFLRPGGETHMRPISPGEHAFLSATMSGASLGAACEAALTRQAEIDLSNLIADAFSSGFFIKIAQQGGANHGIH